MSKSRLRSLSASRFTQLQRSLYLSLSLLLPCLCSCSVWYSHSIESKKYTIYSDVNKSELDSVHNMINQSYRGLESVFTRSGQLKGLKIAYSPEKLAQMRIFLAEPKQEGFYLPFFHWIHLAPRNYYEDRRNAKKIIHHELSHHFLIGLYPESDQHSWLSEGLACCFEHSFWKLDEFFVPLYHPRLHQHAKLAGSQLAKEAMLKQSLDSLLDSGWLHFRHAKHKARSYAFSWAIVYFHLKRQSGSLEERIAALVKDVEKNNLDLAGFQEWLERPMEDELEEICIQGSLGQQAQPEGSQPVLEQRALKQWALDQWAQLPSIHIDRLLKSIPNSLQNTESSWFRSELIAKSLQSSVLAAQLKQGLVGLEEEVKEALVAAPNKSKIKILNSFQHSRNSSFLFRPAVRLLESPAPEVRAAAAAALSRIAAKPTISNPSFWAKASLKARDQEVMEWRIWLRLNGY